MKTKVTGERGARVFVIVFDPGDEVIEGLTAFAKQNEVTSAHFHAIGAFREATLAWFDFDTKEYIPIEVGEQVEVASLIGNIALHEGAPRVHSHAVVSRRDGTTAAGHVMKGFVRPTLEVFVSELPVSLERREDAKSKLPLIRL